MANSVIKKSLASEFTPHVVDLTAVSSKITIAGHNVRRNGSLVAGSLQLTVNETIPAWESLVTGFPPSANNVEIILVKSDSSNMACLYVQGGILRNRSKAIPAGEWYCSLSYIYSR